MTEAIETKPLVDGLVFPEGPRWRDGRLWFSDMEGERIMSCDATGSLREELRLDDYPSGLGWLPDGTLLAVSVRQAHVLAVRDGRPSTHADLGVFGRSYANDMVVARDGRAYVGLMGFDIWSDPDFKPGALALVRVDGTATLVADGLAFPNGAVLADDEQTLIVAQSLGAALTAFSVRNDGSLGSGESWAETPGEAPDGICLDAAGGIWIASALTGRFVRYERGGRETHRIQLPEGRGAFAVALGGVDGDTLYLMTSSAHGDSHDARLASRPGAIITARAPHRAA